jgi:membrane-associated phospholipid phosphatase
MPTDEPGKREHVPGGLGGFLHQAAQRIDPALDAGKPLAIGATVLILLEVCFGLLLVRPLADSRIVRSDLAWERWLADHRTRLLNAVARGCTLVAETVPVIVLLLIALVVAWRASSIKIAPVFLALAIGGEKLIYLVTSLVVGRDRPPVETLGHTYATTSFPSGHVASAITLYGSIALLATVDRPRPCRRVLLVGVALIAAAVGLARMYRGFHYPTDVLAGVFLGVCWLTIVWRLLMRPVEARRTQAREALNIATSGASALEGDRPLS